MFVNNLIGETGMMMSGKCLIMSRENVNKLKEVISHQRQLMYTSPSIVITKYLFEKS